jgi:hypothetical protein
MHLPSAAVIAAALALVVLIASPARAVGFTGGPSVRVNPNNEVEFEWITDVTWLGKVEVFNNPDATGIPVLEKRSLDAIANPVVSTHHTVNVNVSAPLAADTGYFFKVTATDPTGSQPPFSTPTALPPFFTGAQVIENVFVLPGMDSALISWEANVIGFGQVDYGLTLFPIFGAVDAVNDNLNITNHAIELTGLSPGTTYQYRVSNRHAIDGDALVEQIGSFTTVVPEPSAFALAALGMLGLMACALRRARCSGGNRANQGLAMPASLR